MAANKTPTTATATNPMLQSSCSCDVFAGINPRIETRWFVCFDVRGVLTSGRSSSNVFKPLSASYGSCVFEKHQRWHGRLMLALCLWGLCIWARVDLFFFYHHGQSCLKQRPHCSLGWAKKFLCWLMLTALRLEPPLWGIVVVRTFCSQLFFGTMASILAEVPWRT